MDRIEWVVQRTGFILFLIVFAFGGGFFMGDSKGQEEGIRRMASVMDARTVVAQDEDQQVLVTIYGTGEIEVATRPQHGDVWGPPLEIREDSGE